jgi:hypothetical protein
MAGGKGLTVKLIEVLQPSGNVYVMIAVPAATLPIMPDKEPIVATPELLLDQVPVPIVSLKVSAKPIQTDLLPIINPVG